MSPWEREKASLATLLLHEKATSDGDGLSAGALGRLSLLPYLIFIRLQIRKKQFRDTKHY